ncbi:MAG TPA: polysaccharide deacetylase, partial [Dehalococcoidia bacterium]|nr:polysaccharide deacetylase [Dehalococcoidia bacterium]
QRLVEYIRSHDGVQFHTFNEIADDFLASHPGG